MMTIQHRTTTTAAAKVAKKDMSMIRGLLVVLVAGMMAMMTMTTTTHAFSPAGTPQPRVVSLSSVGKAVKARSFLMMSLEEGDDQKKQPAVSADGTFYDDEIDSAPVKDGISDSMKARLMREASTGLDADKAQTNVLLYIILGVAALVVLGGAGIFY